MINKTIKVVDKSLDLIQTLFYVSVAGATLFLLYKLYKMLKNLNFGKFGEEIKKALKPTPLTEEQRREISKTSPSLVGGAWTKPSPLYKEYLERVKSGKVDTSMTLKEFWTEERKKEYLDRIKRSEYYRYLDTQKRRYETYEEYWKKQGYTSVPSGNVGVPSHIKAIQERSKALERYWKDKTKQEQQRKRVAPSLPKQLRIKVSLMSKPKYTIPKAKTVIAI
jgi:hypothetical protein